LKVGTWGKTWKTAIAPHIETVQEIFEGKLHLCKFESSIQVQVGAGVKAVADHRRGNQPGREVYSSWLKKHVVADVSATARIAGVAITTQALALGA
jgi:hypothetical protein